MISEHALVRQQLIMLQRQVKHPRFRPLDRVSVVLLASRVPNWKQALLPVQPETLLRWHRQRFRLVWNATSARRLAQPRCSKETRTSIIKLAAEHR